MHGRPCTCSVDAEPVADKAAEKIAKDARFLRSHVYTVYLATYLELGHALLPIVLDRANLGNADGVMYQSLASEPPLQVFAFATHQLAPVYELALEPELMIDSNDQQLLEVSLALDEHMVVAFLWRDGLHLNKSAANGAV